MSPVIGVKVKLNLHRHRRRNGSISNLSTSSNNSFLKNKYKFRSIPSLVINRLKSTTSSPRRNRSSYQEPPSVDHVIFRVGIGPQKHKFTVDPLILTGKSEVFRRMLESPQWTTGNDSNRIKEIEIVDVKPEAFRLLLISVKSGVKRVLSHLSVSLALDTYYAAHKYNVVDLEVLLIKYLHRNSNPDNILELLAHADFYGLHVLSGFCWSIIEKQTLQVVRSDAFAFLKWDLLCGILENGRLTVGEYELFLGILRWCASEGRRPENYGKKHHELIGVAIYKIRFPLMTPSEFDLVIKTGLLKRGEIEDLTSNFRKNTTYCHQIRRNDCHCRRYRLPCKLCTGNHYPVMPVDGRNLNILQNGFQFLVANSLAAIAGNNNNINVNLSEQGRNKCECMKYASCPAYPNGVSASIMIASNLFA